MKHEIKYSVQKCLFDLPNAVTLRFKGKELVWDVQEKGETIEAAKRRLLLKALRHTMRYVIPGLPKDVDTVHWVRRYEREQMEGNHLAYLAAHFEQLQRTIHALPDTQIGKGIKGKLPLLRAIVEEQHSGAPEPVKRA